ncbi:MAG: MCE family protein [Leptolyngbyaceae cyanobacterium MAG.088]|nr:MCE family protein [Leptolyngbyaceae cyanobacterium MAG.088]
MQARGVREGSVGLLILAGLGLFVGLFAWLRGASFGRSSYALTVELPDTLGLNVGSPVRFRGVKVGEVTSLRAQTNGVVVTLDIQPATLLIPRDSSVEASQSGFIGQVALDFRPKPGMQRIVAVDSLSPFEPNCDRTLIFCNGDRLGGQVGANFDDLIRATTNIATQLGETDLKQTLVTLSTAARSVTQLSRSARVTLRDVSGAANGLSQLSRDTRQQLQNINGVTTSVTQAASQVGNTANQLGQLSPKISTTVDQLGTAANEITTVVKVNRGTLTTTLNNLNGASQDLKVVVNDLAPIIGRVQQGKLIENLETLAANGAQASENLNTLTATLNNPVTLLGVAQTLDSARVTFQNTQKITTDLEQLTGNAEFRENLIKLINGLSKLVSSTQSLEQQLYAVKGQKSKGLWQQPGQSIVGGRSLIAPPSIP